MDIKRIIFVSEIESKLRGLELQKSRVIIPPEGLSPVHDADLYMVLARRLFRDIENTQEDSRVANLKGKKKDLLNKIKMRDHFEHGFDIEQLPTAENVEPEALQGTIAGALGNIKIATSVFNKNGHVTIVSGATSWDLEADHQALIETVQEFSKLFPFKVSS